MDKLVLKNGYSINIEDGASLGNIVHIAANETDALEVCSQLTKANVETVEFWHDDLVVSHYENITKTVEPSRVNTYDDEEQLVSVTVTISLREKTELEMRLDAIEASQSIQDGAIEDIGEAISDIMEGV